MRKSILLIVLVCLFGSIVYAQDWVTFTKSTPEPPIVNIVESNNQQVEFNVEVCGMFKTDITEESESFQRIEIHEAGKTSETGSPELPYIRQLIAIPECENVVLSVNITSQTDFSNYNIYPAPDFELAQEPGGVTYVQEVFTKDETVYAQNTYLPGMNAEIVSIGYLRDQKYAEVFLYPIQFNPVLKSIDVFTHYQVTLDFMNPTSPVNVNTGIFNNVATNTMLNYVSSSIIASINDNVKGNGNVQWIELTEPAQADNIVADYLIICAEPFFEPTNPDSEVLRIANHRASYNGFDVAILSVETIISDDLGFFFEGQNVFPPLLDFKEEQRIRTCIRRIYEGSNAQHTYDGKLGYVLLVGDVYGDNEGMPISEDPENNASVPFAPGYYPNDYYYSCLTNIDNDYDEFGDIFIGRFCINDEAELHNMVEKTIFFESEYIFEDWRNKIVFSNGVDDPFEDDFPLYYGLMNEIITDPFQVSIYNGYEYSPSAVKYWIGQSINEGSLLQIYKGHGIEVGWSIKWNVVFDNEHFNNTISNNGKYPFALSLSCNTGYLDYIEDCMAEFTTSYSENKGFVGFLGSSRQIQGFCNTDLDNISTTIPNAIFTNLSHISGEFILEGKVLSWINQERFGPNYFGDPALNIMALGFEVTQNTLLDLNTTISSEITVREGTTLNIPNNGVLYFIDNGKLIIDEGATLIIGSQSQIYGNNNSQSIIINGNLTIGSQGCSLVALEGQEWNGLQLNNSSKNYSINKLNFENCFLSGECDRLILSNSSFLNSGIKFNNGDIDITICTLNNSNIDVLNSSVETAYVNITSTDITGFSGESAILIDGYNNFSIDDCNIYSNYKDGIGIFNSGGVKGTHEIKNNTISNNGLETSSAGILVYNSFAKIYGNQLVVGNYYGIVSFDNSNVSIRGNSLAEHTYETQQIKDNQRNQVYASQNSFPYEITWNAIIDEDNQYPIVYYRSQVYEELEVSNNYWGANFNYQSDLYPYSYYNYLPIWVLSSGTGGGDGAEALYSSAQVNIEQGDYIGAESELQQIVTDYPTTKYAQAALRGLLSLEEYITGDYSSLKTYYNTEAIIQNNPDLEKLADYLVNYCEIKLGNFPTAISWFENVIQNPETVEDSIFAIIDLGYTYFLMENGGLKSSYTGSMIEHKPQSINQFEEKRDYLLSLIPGDQFNETIKENLSILGSGELLQNTPNPFNGRTQIWYKLENESSVKLNVYNSAGQLTKTINEGLKTKGNHFIDLDANGMENGIYFYSISINGQITDSKKMTLIR